MKVVLFAFCRNIALVYLLTILAFGSSLAETDYTEKRPKPDWRTINKGLTSPTANFMIKMLGTPGDLTESCGKNYGLTNPSLKLLMVKKDFGPFSATGLKPATEAILRVMEKVKKEKPDLYETLGTIGMLCVRKKRGKPSFSNHSWGTGIDITIDGELDDRGDDNTQIGLSELAPYFAEEKFYWGAAFGKDKKATKTQRSDEDSMHFEASKELIEEWAAAGKLKPTSGAASPLMKLLNEMSPSEKTQPTGAASPLIKLLREMSPSEKTQPMQTIW